MAKNDNLYKSTAQDVAEAQKQTPATPTQPTSNVTNAQRADGAIDMNAVQAGASVGRQKGVGAKPISEQVQAWSPQDNSTHQPAPQETAEPTQQRDANESFVRNNVANVQFMQAQVQQPQEQQTPLQQSYNTYTQQHQITSDQRQAIRYRDDAKRLEDQSKGKYLNTRNGFLAKRAGDFLKQYEKQGQTIDDGMKRQAVEEAIKATGGKIADDDDWANTINDIVGRVNSQYTFSNRAAKTLQQLPTADDMMAWYEQGKLGNTHINLIKDANPQLYNEFMQKKQAHDKAQEMASYATDLHETYRDLDESVVDGKGKQIKYKKKTLDNPLEQMEQSIITYLNQEGGLATQANLKTMSQITDTDEIRRLTKEVNELTNRYEEIEDKKFDMLDDIRNKQGIDAFDARIIMADQMRALTREQTLIQRQHRLIAGDLQALKDEAIESYKLQIDQMDRAERARAQKFEQMYKVYGMLDTKERRKGEQKRWETEMLLWEKRHQETMEREDRHRKEDLERAKQWREEDRHDKIFFMDRQEKYELKKRERQLVHDADIRKWELSTRREDAYLSHQYNMEMYGYKSKIDYAREREMRKLQNSGGWFFLDAAGNATFTDTEGNYKWSMNVGATSWYEWLWWIYADGKVTHTTSRGDAEYSFNPDAPRGNFQVVRNGKVKKWEYLETVGTWQIMGKYNVKLWKRTMRSDHKPGIDVDGQIGDPITSPVWWKVVEVKDYDPTWRGGIPWARWKSVVVETPTWEKLRFSHLNSFNVKVWQTVGVNDLLWEMGNTWNVVAWPWWDGSHLDLTAYTKNGAMMDVNDAMHYVNSWARNNVKAREQVIEQEAGQDEALRNVVMNLTWEQILKNVPKNLQGKAFALKAEIEQEETNRQTQKSNREAESKLRKEFLQDPFVEDYGQIITKYQTMKAEHQANSWPGDMAFIFDFMKSLDPTSVVREAEYESAASAIGVLRKRQNTADKFSKWKILSPADREVFLQVVSNVMEARSKTYELRVKQYTSIAQGQWLNPEYVVLGIDEAYLRDETYDDGTRRKDISLSESLFWDKDGDVWLTKNGEHYSQGKILSPEEYAQYGVDSSTWDHRRSNAQVKKVTDSAFSFLQWY